MHFMLASLNHSKEIHLLSQSRKILLSLRNKKRYSSLKRSLNMRTMYYIVVGPYIDTQSNLKIIPLRMQIGCMIDSQEILLMYLMSTNFCMVQTMNKGKLYFAILIHTFFCFNLFCLTLNYLLQCFMYTMINEQWIFCLA